ncbi:MAG: hypothetical protein WC859_01515 [Elusimicrobiota bacterium]|jgi:hypothetical protein
MNPLDEQIEAVTAILRANGGLIGHDPDAPDYAKQAFLQMIMECPECREMVMRNMPPALLFR